MPKPKRQPEAGKPLMNLWHTLHIALQALLRNKLRSFLTMLGIIIGVFAVIAMVAVGDGATARVHDLFASIGTNMLIVLPGASQQGGAFGGFGTQPTLTWDDLKAMRNEVPTVRYAAALLHKATQVASEDHNWNTSVNGTSPDYFAIRDWHAAKGALFTSTDVDGQTKNAVLGKTVVDKLFGASSDPIGQIDSHQRRALSGDRRPRIARGSPCRARITTTWCSFPKPPFNPKFRAACRSM